MNYKEKIKEIRKLILEEKIESIDLKFIDLKGSIRRVTISNDEFDDNLMRDGIGFDGSSVTGFRKVSSGDLVLIPDLETLHYEPFSNNKILSFMCYIKEADTREQYPDDPRYISKKATDYMKSLNLGDTFMVAPEYEFFLFNKVSFDSKSHYSFYHVDSEEGYWNNDAKGNEVSYLPMIKQQGYHRAFPNDRYFAVRQEIVNTMKMFNIPFKYHHHEVAGPSQHEIEIPLVELFKACEYTVLIKYIVKNIARKYGLFATFMPKPLSQDAGSGLHMHMLIKKNNKNIFFGNEYAGLSKEALYFMGGILHHGRALVALTNPSTNSYKRLVPGFEAPTNLFFSLGNRSAAIRIPKYATSEDEKRFEFRTPDATCNPYIAIPAILMAGLDGVKNKIDPTVHGYGPFDKNIHDLSDEERKKIKSIPSSFNEALDELEKDHKFLLEGEVFTKNFIDAYIRTKRKELDSLNREVTPLEYLEYFDC